MTKAALDYSKLARLYDDYCVYAGDIGFFRRCVRDWPGETLELMAGTGRVSLPLARDGASLTCVDSSPAMLGVLHRKLRGAGTGARIVCADARSLPFRCTFQLVLLPFQGLTELPSANDQARALRAAADLLSPSGRFVCTTHNPAVRLRSVDGSWQRVGTFPRRDGGSLTVHILGTYDASSGVVQGQQRISTTDASGASSDLVLDLRFRLVSLDELLALAGRAGLRLAARYGDYDGAAYDAASSPVLIAVFERAG